jgi:8-amino-7-oxononanoate synthase
MPMTAAEDPLAWIDDELAALEERDLRRRLQSRRGRQGPTIELDGRTLVNFGSNDYLGLAGDPRLVEAAIRNAREEGVGAGASPLVAGHSEAHEQLERSLAEFEGTEAAIVFPSGFAANVGTVTALAGRDDAIFADQLNHASLIDGCRLSRADVHVYPHRDLAELERMLAARRPHRRRLIVTDSLFSMDGDLAPLAEIAALARRYDAMLLIDEAHATGIFGEHGRGVAEALGVEFAGMVRVGTLSKALGVMGGFVCGSRSLIDFVANRARTYVFSTAPSPLLAGAAIEALQIVAASPEGRRQLLERAAGLRDTLRSQGWNVGDSASQIIPILVGPAKVAVELSARLAEQGCYVPAIRPPSVSEGEARLRLSLSAVHDESALEKLVAAFARSRPRS